MLTKEEIEKQIAVMKACADGKTIEFSVRGEGRWIERSWDDSRKFDWIHYDYRIKQESAYRPFKNKEECWAEMQKHQPFGWICNVDNMLIIRVEEGHPEPGIIISTSSCDELRDLEYMNASHVFKHYVFIDGTPFGIREE